jgi:hypothetical protein
VRVLVMPVVRVCVLVLELLVLHRLHPRDTSEPAREGERLCG